MADITPKARLKNSHSHDQLTLGHFGRPIYDPPTGTWTFIRESQDGQDGEAQSAKSGLVRVHSQSVYSAPVPSLSLHPPNTAAEVVPRRFTEREDAVRFALNATSQKDPDASVTTPVQDTTPACIAFGYALSPYEVGQHSLLLPIMVTTRAHEGVLNVTFFTGAEHEETEHSLPELEQHSHVLRASCTGAVLGLCFSADKHFLAVRQMWGTSIVMLVHGRTLGGSRSVTVEDVITLPRTRTGGYQHAHVSFHPRSRHHLGVIDTHGNWSTWQLHGRRSQSSRILYRVQLHASGKLLPSGRNMKHFGNDLFFDGWHRICCLERSAGDYALLICNRGVACTFNFDGEPMGDVDLRLGRSALRTCILDIQPSLHHPGVCFVLTSTHLQVMRLASVVKKHDDLDLLCSWPHYHGGSSLPLSLHIIDNPQATCIILFASGTDLQIHWLRWSDDILRARDPCFLTLPQPDPPPGSQPTGLGIATIRASDAAISKPQRPSQTFVHTVLSSPDGSYHSAVYTFDDTLHLDNGTLERQDVLVLAPSKELRYKSSRMVEEEYDLLDFVLPDELSLSQAQLMRHVSISPTRTGRPMSKTRDWPDIINMQSNRRAELSIDDALSEFQGRPEQVPAEETYLQILSERLPEIHISDIEAASSSLAAFVQHTQHDSKDHGGMQRAWRSNIPNPSTLFDEYTEIFAKYVENLGIHVPGRAKVQTERICRAAVLDKHLSLVAESHSVGPSAADLLLPIDNLHMRSSPPSSLPAATSTSTTPHESVLEVLKRYTRISEDATGSLSSTTAKDVLAHLPDDLLDPRIYSYKTAEDRLKKSRTQQELDDMDERARGKAERAALREERRKQRQSDLRNAVTQQSVLVPGLIMSSPQRDPRVVQSSQLAPLAILSSQPGLPMTQPERGTHGERRRVRKEGKPRIKGF